MTISQILSSIILTSVSIFKANTSSPHHTSTDVGISHGNGILFRDDIALQREKEENKRLPKGVVKYGENESRNNFVDGNEWIADERTETERVFEFPSLKSQFCRLHLLSYLHHLTE